MIKIISCLWTDEVWFNLALYIFTDTMLLRDREKKMSVNNLFDLGCICLDFDLFILKWSNASYWCKLHPQVRFKWLYSIFFIFILKSLQIPDVMLKHSLCLFTCEVSNLHSKKQSMFIWNYYSKAWLFKGFYLILIALYNLIIRSPALWCT